MQVFADDKPERVAAGVGLKSRRDFCRFAGEIAIAAVENLALVEHNRLVQAVRANVLD